ncbi:uncharacterized protein TNCV_2432161 [Trichonephila clavipes]|nr:uncharacterized protein TNCV_2432161 [Trichonephila clavipes]
MLVQDMATNFAQLKEALTKNSSVVRSRKDLEVKFYSTHQGRGQEPTDFIYDLLKVHKELGLRMSEEALVEHIFARLEHQVQDYVEVKNPTTTAQLLQVMAKFEERYSCKGMQSSRSNENMGRRDWDVRRGSNDDDNRRNWRDAGSKIVLDFDRKSLAIPDSKVEKIIPSIDEGNLDIDFTKTGLEENQKQELQDLFNSFKGLFSDKPGLTHVLCHEIDTGDKPSVVSRPYLYDRVKQGILDYHVKKMLKEGNLIPIQFPYASTVVQCRKNIGLPPDNPEAY